MNLYSTEIHDVEQTKKMTTLITCETTFDQNVRKLLLGDNIFDLDFGFQIDPIKQRIQRNSVGSGYVSHRKTFALYDHFDSQRDCLQKYTTDLRIEKNLRL